MGSEEGDAQAYFLRMDDGRFMPTAHVGGAWNVAEQHVAPAIGLLLHAVEADHAARRSDCLQVARLSYDIWGVIPMDAVEIAVTVLRPGRTIELVEARLSHGGRTAIVVRAWLTQAYDSNALAMDNFPPLPPPEAMPAGDPSALWDGGFIASVQVRRLGEGQGRARCWVRSPFALLEDESVSPTARMMGLADIANGLAPLASPKDAAFPNLDLTAHLFRQPVGDWLGFDVSVSGGTTGLGITHSILHDGDGAFATLMQSLTIRPRP
ncbi:thioesterase family protein [Sphingobium sp. Leaf26]|uniref:thioesterase family protein n=1 Tax=Sphingobium sp. Leaf26 TaxID=1735693 RepID=UPI000B05639B|nr:thioesterase family protein [Sphingobium sp. Leaf26]